MKHTNYEKTDFAQLSREAVRLALVRLALNLPTVLYPDTENPGNLPDILSEEQKSLLFAAASKISAGEALSEDIRSEAFSQREKNTEEMRLLSSYIDRFTVYEYILNRIEHKFDMFMLPEDYSDEAFAEKILETLAAQKDQTARQPLLLSVIEQLPMRMSYNRFYQIVEDGLSVYADADRETIDQLFFLLRSTALLDSCEGFGSSYPKLDELVSEFSLLQPDDIGADTWQSLSDRLTAGMKELDERIDNTITRQEILNDLCVLCLLDTDPGDTQQVQCAECIASAISLCGQEDAWDRLMPQYTALEGLQEKTIGRYDRLSSAYDDCSDPVLLSVQKLLSSSRFTAIRTETLSDQEEMPEGYLGILSTRFLEDIAASFKGRPRMVNRAVMSRLLTVLPAFLRSYDELENYIAGSLSSCSNPAEKKAAYEIITGLLTDAI